MRTTRSSLLSARHFPIFCLNRTFYESRHFARNRHSGVEKVCFLEKHILKKQSGLNELSPTLLFLLFLMVHYHYHYPYYICISLL